VQGSSATSHSNNPTQTLSVSTNANVQAGDVVIVWTGILFPANPANPPTMSITGSTATLSAPFASLCGGSNNVRLDGWWAQVATSGSLTVQMSYSVFTGGSMITVDEYRPPQFDAASVDGVGAVGGSGSITTVTATQSVGAVASGDLAVGAYLAVGNVGGAQLTASPPQGWNTREVVSNVDTVTYDNLSAGPGAQSITLSFAASNSYIAGVAAVRLTVPPAWFNVFAPLDYHDVPAPDTGWIATASSKTGNAVVMGGLPSTLIVRGVPRLILPSSPDDTQPLAHALIVPVISRTFGVTVRPLIPLLLAQVDEWPFLQRNPEGMVLGIRAIQPVAPRPTVMVTAEDIYSIQRILEPHITGSGKPHIPVTPPTLRPVYQASTEDVLTYAPQPWARVLGGKAGGPVTQPIWIPVAIQQNGVWVAYPETGWSLILQGAIRGIFPPAALVEGVVYMVPSVTGGTYMSPVVSEGVQMVPALLAQVQMPRKS
jgi:hypothetical protein